MLSPVRPAPRRPAWFVEDDMASGRPASASARPQARPANTQSLFLVETPKLGVPGPSTGITVQHDSRKPATPALPRQPTAFDLRVLAARDRLADSADASVISRNLLTGSPGVPIAAHFLCTETQQPKADAQAKVVGAVQPIRQRHGASSSAEQTLSMAPTSTSSFQAPSGVTEDRLRQLVREECTAAVQAVLADVREEYEHQLSALRADVSRLGAIVRKSRVASASTAPVPHSRLQLCSRLGEPERTNTSPLRLASGDSAQASAAVPGTPITSLGFGSPIRPLVSRT
ncbi:hypothetical protein ACKKBF_B33945 [Auxenochlorella protothecoides x Auxenochlorella symbiontica]